LYKSVELTIWATGLQQTTAELDKAQEQIRSQGQTINLLVSEKTALTAAVERLEAVEEGE